MNVVIIVVVAKILSFSHLPKRVIPESAKMRIYRLIFSSRTWIHNPENSFSPLPGTVKCVKNLLENRFYVQPNCWNVRSFVRDKSKFGNNVLPSAPFITYLSITNPFYSQSHHHPTYGILLNCAFTTALQRFIPPFYGIQFCYCLFISYTITLPILFEFLVTTCLREPKKKS